MDAVVRALARAMGSLVHPTILLILLIPMVVAALAFVHLCLDELARLRAEEKLTEGEVVSVRRGE